MTKSISELAAAAAESEAALRDGLARMGRKVGGGPLGGNLGGVAMDQARAHPFATAIIGAGLAWLALAGRGTATPDPKPENLMNWEDEGGLPAKVGEIDEERGKVKVMVPMFGRETPVELEADQVQRI